MQKVTLTFKCLPGMGANLLGALQVALVETRAFDGCRSVETFFDADNPDYITLIEEWDARAQHEKYMNWRLEGGMMELLAPIVAEPLELHYLDAHPA
jgi:quinol monooxygenase YgiN